MKIIATIRTLNEEKNIEACCEAYQFADEILIADGGSTDRTVELAQKYSNVSVSYFGKRAELQNGIWRNPDGEHLTFLWDWAKQRCADWIISQDCDQRPNKFLKLRAREMFAYAEVRGIDFMMGVQIFLWLKDQWFPEMSKTEQGQWRYGMWAHRASINLKILDRMPHYVFSLNGETEVNLDQLGIERKHFIEPPMCYMHFKWDTEESVEQMVTYYRISGLAPTQVHPCAFGGSPTKLEDWMIE